MKNTTSNQETTAPTAHFSPLDVLGISLSTLLFTLVWVGVFSVFLPERSEMVLSDGLKQLAAKSSTHSATDESLTKVLERLQSYTKQTTVNALNVTLEVVQTGGNMNKILALTSKTVRLTVCSLSSCSSATVEMAQATSKTVKNVSSQVVGSAYEYFDTVTFGLLTRTNAVHVVS